MFFLFSLERICSVDGVAISKPRVICKLMRGLEEKI